ncbi:hypothetical protein PR048_010154 [Dryococelus australis]|uniref:CUB domain-containing protein n=1 Tax=Dryococelus australis TaxID=614101 RepID=A0ABQ9I1W7_9NEOP|nr:hypothetical protein PR048_010154 [Dryococelus australis]
MSGLMSALQFLSSIPCASDVAASVARTMATFWAPIHGLQSHSSYGNACIKRGCRCCRLDFDQFSIAGPEPVNHVCSSDQFIVSGGSQVPAVCGVNTGNHMYVDAGVGATNPVTLTMVTSGPSLPRTWKIKVCQIPCNTLYRVPSTSASTVCSVLAGVSDVNRLRFSLIANTEFRYASGRSSARRPRTCRRTTPVVSKDEVDGGGDDAVVGVCSFAANDGCVQYFTGVSGQIKSYNYNTGAGLQLSNQDYTACIRTERNFCGIQYTSCPDTVNNRTQSFTLTGNTRQGPVASSVGTLGPNSCTTDWLIIPCASNVGRVLQPGASTCVDRICGGTFNTEAGSLTPTSVVSEHSEAVPPGVPHEQRGGADGCRQPRLLPQLRAAALHQQPQLKGRRRTALHRAAQRSAATVHLCRLSGTREMTTPVKARLHQAWPYRQEQRLNSG